MKSTALCHAAQVTNWLAVVYKYEVVVNKDIVLNGYHLITPTKTDLES